MKTFLPPTLLAAAFVVSCASPSDEVVDSQLDTVSRPGARRAPDVALVAGGYHTCALVMGRGVTCWGRDLDGIVTPPELHRPTQISAGVMHTCALDDDGVKCWGENYDGESNVPKTLRGPRQVSAGGDHTCALDDDGVKCWGNLHGEMPELHNPRQLAGGSAHHCALDDEGVKCWGGDVPERTSVPALRNPRELVGVGGDYTCALDDDGVKCWGGDDSGKPGAVLPVPALKNVLQVAIGSGAHGCALASGSVKCWGKGERGQTTVPALVRPTQIAVGGYHTCALDDDGVKCWGSDDYGQGSVPRDLELVGRHTCVATNDGTRCAGFNERGQIGLGDDEDHVVALSTTKPTELGRAFATLDQLALGNGFSCALAGGAVKCWGYNARGQLGLGDTRDRGLVTSDMGSALPALRFGGIPMAKVGVGDSHACAVGREGQLFCWGKGSSGQLGTESTNDVGTTEDPARPRLKMGLTVRDVALGRAHTCLLGNEGAVYCFGRNASGQLGLGKSGSIGGKPGTLGDAMEPVKLGAGFVVKSLASGDDHVCALSTDGRVKCWGDNAVGQLGLGDRVSRGAEASDLGDALPVVDLGANQTVADLACGARHCCARFAQNTLKCWGDNAEGQLGLGDRAARGDEAGSMGDALPFVEMPAREAVTAILLDASRTCARTDSGLRCWGRNRSGELGYGDLDPRGGTQTTLPKLLEPLGI